MHALPDRINKMQAVSFQMQFLSVHTFAENVHQSWPALALSGQWNKGHQIKLLEHWQHGGLEVNIIDSAQSLLALTMTEHSHDGM